MEVESKIPMQTISILIAPGSSQSYISPKVVKTCMLPRNKHKKSYLVLLDTRTKKRITKLVE